MEFVEEESRPRFLFQSRSSPPFASLPDPETLSPNKLHIVACYASASVLLFLAFYLFSDSQTLNFILIWIALSLLIAPFAPSSLTGGDPFVGRGDILPPLEPSLSDPHPPPARRPRSRRPDKPLPSTPAAAPRTAQSPIPKPNGVLKSHTETQIQLESEWTDDDFEILKKQISKHPVGEPSRWEKITDAFAGRHKLDTVIKMGKSLSERRPEAKDSFQQFLKHRKPVDKRVVEVVEEEVREIGRWSSSEDIALLNALKAFPKDAAMRWEKVAAAVPGRTKGECLKRVTELKRDFRSSKGSES